MHKAFDNEVNFKKKINAAVTSEVTAITCFCNGKKEKRSVSNGISIIFFDIVKKHFIAMHANILDMEFILL